MLRLSNATVPSTPYTVFLAESVSPVERVVAMSPTLLRRRMSRFTRKTEKLVMLAFHQGLSRCPRPKQNDGCTKQTE